MNKSKFVGLIINHITKEKAEKQNEIINTLSVKEGDLLNVTISLQKENEIKNYSIPAFSVNESPRFWTNDERSIDDETQKTLYTILSNIDELKKDKLSVFAKAVLYINDKIDNLTNGVHDVELVDKHTPEDIKGLLYGFSNVTIKKDEEPQSRSGMLYRYNNEYFEDKWELITSLASQKEQAIANEYSKFALFKYYQEHINIEHPTREDLSMYSDWHKDVFGYRPRGEFGQYVSPYENYENDSMDDMEIGDF